VRWLIALVLLAGCGTARATQPDDEPHKVFVCKYVSTPGEDERLQTGDNPISVDISSLVGPEVEVNIGDSFQDAQIRSVVIAFDIGQPEPGVDECPQPTTTTTTTAGSTTTSTGATTTTCPGCVPNTVVATTTSSVPTTSSTAPPSSSTTTSTSPPSTSSTVVPSTTSPPPTFQFAGATTVCIVEVPTIRITFANTFPALAGQTGTLTMAALDGTVVSTQPLVYRPNTTIDLLYPGTRVNADGSIADVPGWNLTNAGLWVRDPSDEFLREGIVLTYTVNPTATATVTYPPESSACANPENPPRPPTVTAPPPGLPPTK